MEKQLSKEKETSRKYLLRKTLLLFITETQDIIVNYDEFAQQWIEILQPYLDHKRASVKRRRVIYNLNSLERDYLIINLEHEKLQNIIDQCPYTDQIDNKIASCIIGIPQNPNSEKV